MSKIRIALIALVALVAGCAPLPPTPQDIEAKRFELAPGQAVIYVVRPAPDLSGLTAPLVLNDQHIGATHAGTYFRLEVPPGRHEIRGYAGDSGSIRIDVQADRIYYIQQRVSGSWRVTNPMSFFSIIDEQQGRAAVMRSVRAG
jgi:hypothetical protein